MATTPDLLIDPDEVVFGADGSVESMTDPDTGEKIISDPKAAADDDLDGPYGGLNQNGEENKTNDDPEKGATTQPAATADEQLVLDMLSAFEFVDDDGNPTDTIEWNGEQTRVRDLSPEDRREFFEQLREQDRAEAAGVTTEEQQLLDFIRGGGDLRQALGVQPEAGTSQVAGLDADALNRLDIKNSLPGLSDEEVEAELQERKAGSLYDKKTGILREQMTVAEQKAAQTAAADEFRKEETLFKTAANQMQKVLDFPITPEVRQFMLQQTATQEQNGQSPFLNSLTPEKVLRLQFLDTYADSIKAHYEAEIKAAYTRGRKEVLQGAPTSPPGRGGAGGARPAAAGARSANTSEYTLGED